MPHITIKSFPIVISDEKRDLLITRLTDAIVSAFDCDDRVISIVHESVIRSDWHDQVYAPEIMNKANLLIKKPNY